MFYPAQFIGTPIEPNDELKLLAVYPLESTQARQVCAEASYILQLILDFSPLPGRLNRRLASTAARGLAIAGGYPHGVPDHAAKNALGRSLADRITRVREVAWDIGFAFNVDGLERGMDRGDAYYTSLCHLPGLPWRLREEWRAIAGQYKMPPWHGMLNPIPDHFVHIAHSDPGLVAFTENTDKGQRDIQTPMKPGRYLTKFYPDMPADEVRRWQALVDDTITVKFAVTADEIQDIYMRGPDSCMAKKPAAYSSDQHPVRAYGDSDIQLAYMVDRDGKPTARALVNREKKIYSVIYGDETRLRPRLEALGYRGDSLAGSKIHRIPQADGRYLMPYIDCPRYVRVVDKDWFELCNGNADGAIYQGDQNTSGLLPDCDEEDEESDLAFCPHCEEHYDPEDFRNVVINDRGHTEGWCQGCADDDAFYCEHSNHLCSDDISTEVYVDENTHRQWGSHRANGDRTYECDATGDTYSRRDCPPVQLNNGLTWNPYTFRDDGARIDGVNYATEDIPDEVIKELISAAMDVALVGLPTLNLTLNAEVRT